MRIVSHVVAIVAGAVFLLASGARAEDAASGPSCNVVHLKRYDTAVDSPGRYLFSQNAITLKEETLYTLTFWAKSSQPLRIKVSTKYDQAPWTGFGTPTIVELSTEWQRYEVPIEGTGSLAGHTRIQFHYVEIDHGDVWIANLQLAEEGTDPTTANLIVNGRFEDKLNSWYIEGIRKDIFDANVVTLNDANTSAEANN